MDNSNINKAMTVEERLELSAKLDKELDAFIDNLPKRKQQDAAPDSRWEEELASHPFFMKTDPEPGSELHPLYEGLQKLKYDPEENEPEELALAYKDDGNFHFKHKKYRMAVISYTEGIKTKCGNVDLEANLHNNRAAAHYFLGNYRSSLFDCEAALKIKPDYDKSLIRAANSCFKLQKFDQALAFCDKILAQQKNNVEVLALRKNCVSEAKLKERNRRKREVAERKVRQEEEVIVGEILRRGIKIEGRDNLTLSKLEPKFPQLFSNRVTLSEHGTLLWPVILFYPEYKIMDYIQQFDEENTFMQQLRRAFECCAPWDEEKKYKPENLKVYFENESRKNIEINVDATLLDVLKLDGHIIKEGTPKFVVLVANSEAERLFLGQS